jgi:hypothetical protein
MDGAPPAGWTGYSSSTVLAPPAPAPFAPYGSPAMPDLEGQTFAEFLREPAAQVTRRLFDYLGAHAPDHPELAGAIPLVQQAAEWYRIGDLTRAFAQAYVAFRAITLLRLTSRPDLPPL